MARFLIIGVSLIFSMLRAPVPITASKTKLPQTPVIIQWEKKRIGVHQKFVDVDAYNLHRQVDLRLAANGPGDFLDADFFTLLLVVVIPLTLHKVNARESSSGLDSLSFPFTLNYLRQHMKLPR